jgi:hypothetical protein
MNTTRRAWLAIGIGVLGTAATACTTATGQAPATLAIKEIGSMHVGGGNVTVSGAALPGTARAGAGRGAAGYHPQSANPTGPR